MKTFKAAVLKTSNKPLEILDLVMPDKIGEGLVLIRIRKAALCGSQIGEIYAIKGEDKFLPHVLGHEAVAEVIQVGSNVYHLKKGDKVIAHWMKNALPDGEKISYQTNDHKNINSGPIAIFSEFALVSQNRLTKIKSKLNDGILAAIGCGFLTSYGIIKRELKLSSDSKGQLLILGFGGIGQITFALLSKFTELEVSILDKNEINISKAKTMGIKNIYLKLEDLKDTKFDYIIDTTGSKEVIEIGFESLSKSGILCLVGVTPAGVKIEIDPMPLHYGQKIVGIYGGQAVPDEDIPEILDLVEEDEKWFQEVIGENYDLLRINEAVESLRFGNNRGRILINFTL